MHNRKGVLIFIYLVILLNKADYFLLLFLRWEVSLLFI